MIDEVVLLRHGRTQYNLVHRLQGQVDVPLDIVGQWQADQSGMALAQRYYWAKPSYIAGHPDALFQPGDQAAQSSDINEYRNAPVVQRSMKVVSSDLCRAAQTAHAFADVLGLPVKLDARLRERDFGRWEGMTRPEIEALDAEAYHSWKSGNGGEQAYGVETRTAVGQRGCKALTDLVMEDAGNPVPTTLLVASHGSFIAATIETLLGLDPEKDVLGFIGNAYWSTFGVTTDDHGALRWKLNEFNHAPAVSHTSNWVDGPDYLRSPDMPKMLPLTA